MSRPGTPSGSSRSTIAAASSGVVVGPSLTPIGLPIDADHREVRAVELPGPLPHPHHVGGRVVVEAGGVLGAGERPLVLEQQRLVAGVELDHVAGGPEVDPDGPHERQRPLDVPGDQLVPLPRRRPPDEVLVPGVHLVQVGEAAVGEAAQQVQRGGAVLVRPHEPARVRDAGGRRRLEAVDRIAAVGREAGRGLDVGGARLGVLAGHPGHLDDRQRGAVGQHHRHLQQRLDLVADRVRRVADEGLGAVTALQQEGLAAGDRGQPLGQRPDLRAGDQRRHRLQLADGLGEDGDVRPGRLLRRREVAPGIESESGSHVY